MEPPRRYARQTALVTGAQGFVGSWLASRLLEEGARVVATRRDAAPAPRFRTEATEERCEVVDVDVTDYQALLEILAAYDVNAVFHLAAQPIVGVANRLPLSTLESNVRGAYTMLEACRTTHASGASLKSVVVASSDHAYGSHRELPYREDFGLLATYPYDASKACADMLGRCYAETYGLPVAVTRLANVYGGGDCHWSRIVPDCSRALVRGERPIIRSDGTPERDFLYVEDAVEAYLTVGLSLLEDPTRRGRAWNAGVGRPVSVLELVQRLIAASGKNIEPDVRGTGTPDGEIDRQYLDSTAIREELGWAPVWDLDTGLERAYAWYERHLATADYAASAGGP